MSQQFYSIVEMNDVPMQARRNVSNPINVKGIVDVTGVSITNKGVYYAPGTQRGKTDPPPPYILVEGDGQDDVDSAVMVLKRLLQEGVEAEEEAAAKRGLGA